MEVIISDNDKFTSLHIVCDDEASLSWEQLQAIKDKFYSNLDFIEVYPQQSEIINKSNVRHLIHIKEWQCPKLGDLERNSSIKIKSI